MSSFDAAMEKAEEMRRNAQEALRDLPQVSEVLDAAFLTDDQRQAIHRRLEPMRQVQDILSRAGVVEDPDSPTWKHSPERAASRLEVDSEGSGGRTWEQPPPRLSDEAGGVGSEGGGGRTW